MKIAIVTNFLYPEGIGGTEIYCQQLATALVERGNEVYWFVPNFNQSTTHTEVRGEGINIVKFAAVDPEQKISILNTISSFILEMQLRKIGIAHFHEFGGVDGISPELLPACKKAGIVTVVTFHLANYICKTGTMYFGGVVPCNGRMILSRCSSCNLFSDKTSSQAINLALSKIFDPVLKISLVRSIPRMKRYMDGINLKAVFISIIREHADMVISLTHWFRDVLVVNGIPENKTVYIPQVSPEINANKFANSIPSRKGFVFIGRVDKQKGIDLILQIAKRLKKQLPGTVIDIYGPSYGPYKAENRSLNWAYPGLDNYDNVQYKGFLQPDDVLAVMNNYKGVILPSLVAEMAPLIIMEANALKVPVIVSDVPGSAELTRQYNCGLVFKYASSDDLLEKLIQLEQQNDQFEFKQPAENNFYQTAGIYEKVYKRISKRASNI